MSTALKALCDQHHMLLAYSKDEGNILSMEVIDGLPTIRVHRIFQGCPDEVAKAVIRYFLDYEHKELYLKTIEQYAREVFFCVEYVIRPLDESFRGVMKAAAKPAEQPARKSSGPMKPKVPASGAAGEETGDTGDLVEMSITHISYNDFWGETTDMDPEAAFNASSDKVIDLNITVDSPSWE